MPAREAAGSSDTGASNHSSAAQRAGAGGSNGGSQLTPDELVLLGKSLFEKKGCNGCHTVDGSPRVGASLAGLWGTRVTLVDGSTRVVDEAFVKDAIANPRVVRQAGYRDVMPMFEGDLRPEETQALAAFIESLAEPTH